MASPKRGFFCPESPTFALNHRTMFENLMGNMQEQQKAIQAELKEKRVHGEAGEGAIKVTCNGLREVQNVSLNPEKLDFTDPESIEDLMVVAINRALEKAAELEQSSTQDSIKDLLPPGLGNLFG